MHGMRLLANLLIVPLMLAGTAHANTRPIGLDDIARVKVVADPQVDPSRTQVAYSVSARHCVIRFW